MTLKIYGMAMFSTCTARVLATLLEKGVTDYELVNVNLMDGEQKKPDYLAKQPFGLIPVLEDEQLRLFESRAIARYISHKFEGQGTALYGSNAKEKALTEVWLEVESQNFDPAIGPILVEKIFKPWKGGQTDEAAVAASVEKLNKVLDVYDAHLAKNKYLAGDFFSLADLSHLPFTNLLYSMVKMGDIIDAKPNVKRWWDDISSRPAWKKYLELASPPK